MGKHYYVYMLTNKYDNVLYTGVTGNLARRVDQHKEKSINGFTKRYNVTKLVYYEIFDDPYAAIVREKQIKGGPRRKKVALVNSVNPEWRDLCDEMPG